MVALTVSMPTYGAGELVARAVESVLAQTYTDLVLVVLNDADPDSPWPHLAHIDDPRLVRFDLDANRGRYFADAVTLAACDTPWWTVHDADDWSDPTRLEELFDRQAATGADVVFGGYQQHRLDGRTIVRAPTLIPGQHRHMAHHTAIWRTEKLRAIGGPHPDYRVAYDTLMVSLAVTTLTYAQVDEPRYHHAHRVDSLTQNDETGMKSPMRRYTHQKARHLWKRCIKADPARWPALLAPHPITARHVSDNAARLAQCLQGTRT